MMNGKMVNNFITILLLDRLFVDVIGEGDYYDGTDRDYISKYVDILVNTPSMSFVDFEKAINTKAAESDEDYSLGLEEELEKYNLPKVIYALFNTFLRQNLISDTKLEGGTANVLVKENFLIKCPYCKSQMNYMHKPVVGEKNSCTNCQGVFTII